MSSAGAPNLFGLGAQIFGEEQQEVVSPEHDVDEASDPEPTSDSESENEDDEDEVLATAMASTTLETSEWKDAPAYTTLYMSTVTEYLPPAPKTKLPLEAQVELTAGNDKSGKDSTWSLEGYENSLDVDHVFERFTKRVGYEGEQCIRFVCLQGFIRVSLTR